MSKFVFNSSVDEQKYNEALASLKIAIEKKDTAGEWFDFTVNTLLLVGKIAVSQFGYGPALQLLEQLFGKDQEVVGLLKTILETQENA